DRLTNRWSAQMGTTTYKWDAVNMTNIAYPTTTSPVYFKFDPMNRVTNMVDGMGTTTYSYDGTGQLLTEDGPFSSDTVTNTYSNRKRIAMALQQPTGLWTNGFIYDPAKRLTNVTSQAGSFGYIYSPALLVQELTLPNGSYITNRYDPVA